MITKPSLSELLEGIAKTAEQVLQPALEGSSVVEHVTSILMLLDRVEAEWPLAARHLLEDNVDIELTLQRIERIAAVQVHDADADGATQPASIGARTRRAQPPAEGGARADDGRRWTFRPARTIRSSCGHADQEVRELLSRILRRERSDAPHSTAGESTQPGR